MRDKISKLCDSFMGERFEIPAGRFEDKLTDVKNKIKETIEVMTCTQEEVKKYLVGINTIEGDDVSALIIQRWFILKEKALYETLNTLRFGDKLLVGLFWTPISKKHYLEQSLQDMR